jgi:hypothetical protein
MLSCSKGFIEIESKFIICIFHMYKIKQYIVEKLKVFLLPPSLQRHSFQKNNFLLFNQQRKIHSGLYMALKYFLFSSGSGSVRNFLPRILFRTRISLRTPKSQVSALDPISTLSFKSGSGPRMTSFVSRINILKE